MKRILQLSIVCLLSQTTFAQITITSSDMPSVNDIKVVSIGDPNDVTTPDLTGSNYSWDFSMLSAVQQRVDTFLSVSATPFAYQLFFNNQIIYPDNKADYGVPAETPNLIPQLSLTDVINYYSNQGNVYKQVGFGANINGIPASVRYTPTDTLYQFPLNYGDDASNDSYFELTVPGFGFYGQWLTRIDTVDGWGTVMTPYGTFDVLRVKSTLFKTDTVYVDAISFGTTTQRPTETEYKWLAVGNGIPVLTIAQTNGNTTRVEYLDTMLNLNIVKNDAALVSIYPNPTNQFTKITSSVKMNSISVYDYNGRLISSDNVNDFYYQLKISSNLHGIYLITIETDKDVIVKRLMITN